MTLSPRNRAALVAILTLTKPDGTQPRTRQAFLTASGLSRNEWHRATKDQA